MKKIGLFLGLTLLLFGCNKEEDFVKEVRYTVTVTYGDVYDNLKAENANVVLTNKQTAVTYKAATDAEGVATFSIPAGTYGIEASRLLKDTEAQELLGVKEEVSFNASDDKVTVNEQNLSTELKMVSGRIGNLLIKQLYYGGSDKTLGAYDRDQFVELHNNSNETLYLDNLCFALLYGVTTPNKEGDFLLPNGQFDWSKSPELAGLGNKANTDYAYAHMVVAFPGTGKDYPIEAGKSVIIARTAQNHKAPLTIGKKTFTVENPELTVDLSKAPFETYFPDKFDIDNPKSVNLILKKGNGMPDMFLNFRGNESYAIFYATEEMNSWKGVQSPEPSKRKKYYLQIPVNAIIDGVNLQNNTTPLPTQLPETVDAGSSKSIKGAFTSEATIRKVSKRIGDKVFYQDTNNSTNDFESIDRPDTSSLN